MIHLHTSIDSELYRSYIKDKIIVVTDTVTTGYNDIHI